MTAALKDADAGVRASAAESLGSFRAEPAATAAALGGALGDGDVSVRARAAQSLARLGPLAKDAVPALVRALQNDQSSVVRLELIDALAAVKPPSPEAVAALTAALNDQNRKVRKQAAAGLAKITATP